MLFLLPIIAVSFALIAAYRSRKLQPGPGNSAGPDHSQEIRTDNDFSDNTNGSADTTHGHFQEHTNLQDHSQAGSEYHHSSTDHIDYNSNDSALYTGNDSTDSSSNDSTDYGGTDQ
jgi:hypothetical protein